MATEQEDFYAEEIYGVKFGRCTLLERERIDTIIKRKELENANSNA